MNKDKITIEVDETPVVDAPNVEGQDYILSEDGTVLTIIRQGKQEDI